jgi:aromatic-L-amino-acid decarboxylase
MTMGDAWSLTDGVVTIRPPRPGDATVLVAGRDDESRRWLGEGVPDPTPMACVVVDDEVVGWVDYDHPRAWLPADGVNIGYGLFPGVRGRGLATRAVRLLLRRLADEAEFALASVLIDPDNGPSLAVARRVGFAPAGEVNGSRLFVRGIERDRSFHMTPDEFRRRGHETVDWIASYLEGVGDLPVAPAVMPGAVRAQLPPGPPDDGERFDGMLADVDRIVVPALMHWQSPNFFGYFPANGSGPAILGELLSAGLGVQGMLWATSPAATELETHVLDWVVDLLALPDRFRSSGAGGGVIQDSASSAALCALLAARERAGDVARDTITGYVSTETHSSVEKGWRVAGLRPDLLRKVPVDAAYALDPGALARLIAGDVAAGLHPIFAVATVGTTSSNAMDPIAAVADAVAPHGIWLHVDAAMSGTAAVCPEHRWIHAGLERADSYCFNPHKWMFTNFDCDCFYVADRAALIRALSILPEYLRNEASESGAVIDYRDWQIPLGRRFRAL